MGPTNPTGKIDLPLIGGRNSQLKFNRPFLRRVGNYYQLSGLKPGNKNVDIKQSLHDLGVVCKKFGFPLEVRAISRERFSAERINIITTILSLFTNSRLKSELVGLYVEESMSQSWGRASIKPAPGKKQTLHLNPIIYGPAEDKDNKLFTTLVLHEIGHIIDGFWLDGDYPPMKFNPRPTSTADILISMGGQPFAPYTSVQIRGLIDPDLSRICHPDFVCDFVISYVLFGERLRQYVNAKAEQGYPGARVFYDQLRQRVFDGREYLDIE